jgi:hypothetical protein
VGIEGNKMPLPYIRMKDFDFDLSERILAGYSALMQRGGDDFPEELSHEVTNLAYAIHRVKREGQITEDMPEAFLRAWDNAEAILDDFIAALGDGEVFFGEKKLTADDYKDMQNIIFLVQERDALQNQYDALLQNGMEAEAQIVKDFVTTIYSI